MVRSPAKPGVSLEALTEALRAADQVRPAVTAGSRRAAVAMVLCFEGPDAALLMIQRAHREGDPWSGHMAFPGGKQEPGDTDLQATAERETREELGVDLAALAHRLGSLPTLQAISRGRPSGLVVSPVVYQQALPFDIRLNEEVEEALWIPLHFFMDPANRTSMTWCHGGANIELPCYFWEHRRVWGLSLRMIDDLLSMLGPR